MTNKNQTKSLEEKTASSIESIKDIMGRTREKANKNELFIQDIYDTQVALYEQNRIIIDYLQNIYKNQLEVKK